MENQSNGKVGLGALLTPDNCVLLLIDHQPFQVSGVKNIDAALMINNTVALAKTAKAFNVPALLSTVDRTTINTWEDERCVKWVEKTGRKKIVMAALWTEICLAFPVIHALGDGYDVFFVTDASGGTSVEAHEMGIQRMVQAGAVPLTWGVFMAELQRDWAREATAGKVAEILLEHGGASATNLAWELQLLGTKAPGVGV
jgi:nicotinamidase-related amidase